MQNDATLEVESKRNTLFHLFIASTISRPTNASRCDGVFVKQPTRRIDAINTKIRQRTAATQLLREQPVWGVITERTQFCKQRVDDIDPAQFARRDHLLEHQAARLEILSIRRHEQHFAPAAGVNHVASLLDGGRQRLFAEHMLACFCRRNSISLVLTRRRRNVHSFDQRILEALRKLVVAVSVAGLEILSELLRLFLVTADRRDELRLLAVRERRQHGNLRNTTQPHHGVSDWFPTCHQSLPLRHVRFKATPSRTSSLGRPGSILGL